MFIRSALPRSRLALLRQEGRELNALVVHAAPVDVVKQEANDVFLIVREVRGKQKSKPGFKSKHKNC